MSRGTVSPNPWQHRCPEGHASVSAARGDGGRWCEACGRRYDDDDIRDTGGQR